MTAKKIWMYWENKLGCERPLYLDLALETIKRHSGDYEVVLLNKRTVRDYIKIPNVVKRFSEIAHKADYIRFKILYKYGGVWLDCDTILLRNIEEAIEPFIANYDYIGYGREQGKPSIGFMVSKKGCKLLGMHLEEVDRVLRRKLWRQIPLRTVKLGWSEIGYDILWKIADTYDYYHHARNMFAPTGWSDWRHFFKTDVNVEKYLSHNPFAVVLYNKMMFDSLKNISVQEIMKGKTLLAKLFRKGLNSA